MPSTPTSSTVPKRNKKGKRSGFTTGACSAAAAKAATLLLLRGHVDSKVAILLPSKKPASFALERKVLEEDGAICSVIKDAGDDPDCTHGAHLTAHVLLKKTKGVQILGGEGVAKVTKAGLGLDIGSDAINPVPRKNITQMVTNVLEEHGNSFFRGASVTIHVPMGEEMAKKTTNKRLGLLGGISILGTTGIVQAFSTAAWKISVIHEINVAASSKEKEVILTTGGRSETAAMHLYPHKKEHCFIQMGDFLGIALKACARNNMTRVSIVAMMGKLSKMATGTMQTHAAASQVDCQFLATLAREAGASIALAERICHANTARHVLSLCEEDKVMHLPSVICAHVREQCLRYVKKTFDVNVIMVNFDGDSIGMS